VSPLADPEASPAPGSTATERSGGRISVIPSRWALGFGAHRADAPCSPGPLTQRTEPSLDASHPELQGVLNRDSARERTTTDPGCSSKRVCGCSAFVDGCTRPFPSAGGCEFHGWHAGGPRFGGVSKEWSRRRRRSGTGNRCQRATAVGRQSRCRAKRAATASRLLDLAVGP
jgi:hypothetical protein